jgi:hypothetical protein
MASRLGLYNPKGAANFAFYIIPITTMSQQFKTIEPAFGAK